nr:MAG TPA: hypothetical protein [Caudoviricetes sp.]
MIYHRIIPEPLERKTLSTGKGMIHSKINVPSNLVICKLT